jgi:hypothetical protein
MSSYRFRALKVSPGRKHHGIVTKTQSKRRVRRATLCGRSECGAGQCEKPRLGELYADLVSFPKWVAAGDRLFGDLPAFALSIALSNALFAARQRIW